MGKLKSGDIVKMKSGGEAKVLELLGSGGQGGVYKVSYMGQEYALKWYHKGLFKDKARAFYTNLEKNIQNGAPTEDFLWPLGITKVCDNDFGYIMKLRPEEYHELTEFFVGSNKQKQIRFKSFSAIVDAAINIIQAFRELHNNGYSYQDINNGNFFINPENGRVLICDNDNVSPFGMNLGILGKQRYMAPEIVTGGNPDKQSDRFSLAVILFRLLFVNHPLEGRYSTPPCMTKAFERKYYGTAPVFIYDPVDDRNRPVPGTDHNLKLFWPVYPQYIRDMFIRAFSQDVMLGKRPRVIEREWLDAFLRLKGSIVTCPECGQETFLVQQGRNKCIECKHTINVPNALKLNAATIPLFPGTKILLWHVDPSLNDIGKELGLVVSNPNDKKLFGIKNVSSESYMVELPSGEYKVLKPQSAGPIRKGFRIHFTSNDNEAGLII